MADTNGTIKGLFFWILAPVIVAAGFASGIKIFELLKGKSETSFFTTFIWSLIGCGIGAGAVYWFGPMLIVFGMFLAGTASVALREVILNIRENKK